MSEGGKSTNSGSRPGAVGAFRWQYAALLRYGPWTILTTGLGMIVFAMFSIAIPPVAIAFASLGLLAVVAGVILPRLHKTLKFGTKGFQGDLLGVLAMDPGAFLLKGSAVADEEPPRSEVVEREPHLEEPVTIAKLIDLAVENGWRLERKTEERVLLVQKNGAGRLILPGFLDALATDDVRDVVLNRRRR